MARKSTTISIDDTVKYKGLLLNQVLGYSTLSGLITHLINKEFDDKEAIINSPELLEIYKEAQSIEPKDYDSLCRKLVLEGKINQAKNNK